MPSPALLLVIATLLPLAVVRAPGRSGASAWATRSPGMSALPLSAAASSARSWRDDLLARRRPQQGGLAWGRAKGPSTSPSLDPHRRVRSRPAKSPAPASSTSASTSTA